MLMHPIKTPKPRDWVENTAPTPEQLRKWFMAMTHKEQLFFMEMVTIDGAQGFQCVSMDHDGQIQRLLKDQRKYVANYRDLVTESARASLQNTNAPATVTESGTPDVPAGDALPANNAL